MKRSYLMGALVLVVGIIQTFTSLAVKAQNSYLDSIDQDKDGYISIKEAVSDPNLLAVFGKVDVNGDGKISAQELSETNLLEN